MGLDQRELVEQSLTRESAGRSWERWPRHLYVYEGDDARMVEPGMFISTQYGAYWQVISKDHDGNRYTFMLNEVRATDPRTHNAATTMLFGGILT